MLWKQYKKITFHIINKWGLMWNNHLSILVDSSSTWTSASFWLKFLFSDDSFKIVFTSSRRARFSTLSDLLWSVVIFCFLLSLRGPSFVNKFNDGLASVFKSFLRGKFSSSFWKSRLKSSSRKWREQIRAARENIF